MTAYKLRGNVVVALRCQVFQVSNCAPKMRTPVTVGFRVLYFVGKRSVLPQEVQNIICHGRGRWMSRWVGVSFQRV